MHMDTINIMYSDSLILQLFVHLNSLGVFRTIERFQKTFLMIIGFICSKYHSLRLGKQFDYVV